MPTFDELDALIAEAREIAGGRVQHPFPLYRRGQRQ